ncbi:MAG TPA: Rnase Y domain-containing protein, partial [Candidatus Cloacimonadota bacterium]|nr:Rnase Y domain-containing protein [Candidatus Cloacimonadota bacterium]
MNNPYILGVLGLVLGFVIALVIYFIRRNSSFKLISQANEIADNIKRDAKTEAETSKKEALLEAREEWFKQKRILDEEVKERQRELRSQEKKYNERLGSLDKRLDSLDKKENSLSEQERKLKSKEDELQEKTKEYEHILSEQKNKLAEVAGLTREEALERLRTELINTARQVAANDAKISIEQIKLDTSKKVSEILSTAIQRMAVDHVSETTVSVVSLPSDEMKGRIIGREGRNIRTFEKASGVDLIIDDTPEAVVLSCFDPVRREIARLSLEKLISDGRIHPGRIEEVIAKTT